VFGIGANIVDNFFLNPTWRKTLKNLILDVRDTLTVIFEIPSSLNKTFIFLFLVKFRMEGTLKTSNVETL
jgi:hypothetical protein